MVLGDKADYVIVGMGTAGSVMAKELTEDGRTSVIGIQNGEDLTQEPVIKFSRFALLTVLDGLIGPPFYINGTSTPQRHADDRELLWVLAHPEGGASSVNAGVWCRGTNQVYAEWEKLNGPEWSVDRIIETYKGLENYYGNTLNPDARGYKGPVDIRQVPNPNTVSSKFTNAITGALKTPYVVDYNDPNTPVGASTQVQYTQKGCNGYVRVSSATVLNDAKKKRNLEIKFNSTALRTLWRGKKAIGVEYVQDGELKTVYAKKGVICCAGLYSSSFLMHSGVGAKEMLEDLGIEVKYNNPNVGRNLIDQWMVTMIFATNPKDTTLKNNNSVFSQLSNFPAPGAKNGKRAFRLSVVNPIPGFAVGIFDLLHPKSRGKIYIDSPSPLDPPVIDFEVFSNHEDMDLYVQGFQKYITKISKTLHKQDPRYQLLLPDANTINDTEALKEYIRENVRSNQSFQSHCQMAPRSKGGVVNSQGLVYGTDNLYVADDSIVPLDGMDGSTMATAYLVAANIARMLQQ